MKSQIKVIVLLVTFLLCCYYSGTAKERSDRKNKALSKINAVTPKQIANANNVTSWVQSDGFFNWEVAQSWNGEYPRASGVGTIFAEGIVFGGFVNDGIYSSTLRVTGDTYFIGMQPGKITTDASGNTTGAEAVTDATNRVYAIRQDMPPSLSGAPNKWPNLVADAATFFKKASSQVTDADIQAVAAQYFQDWSEWPAVKGAPWFDDRDKVIRNDASYDPTNPHHVPGLPGASKTLWLVCNDLDNSITGTFAGSPPIGIEEQMTIWSYASSTPLNDIVFKQVKLIYNGVPGAPSTSTIDSMYVAQWADPDLGDAGDDYAGSDSSELSIGYVWNSSTADAKYAAKGLPAPASGYSFLQGVSHYTGVMTDSAVINFQWRKGYAYWHDRPLTAFDYFAANTGISDPDDGTYEGTLQWYNLLRGCLPRPQYPAGTPFYTSSTYAPAHGIVTSYCLSGDPVTGTGWIDGIDLTSGDRRIVCVHGPFSLNLHDTAEVVIALVDGMGLDNISSVKAMKNSTKFALRAYKSLFQLPSPPPNPQVNVSELDQEIVLDWGGNASATVESDFSKGYSFEGYNVYQFASPSSKVEDASTVKIATYDLVDTITTIIAPLIDPRSGAEITTVVQNGNNTGLKRTQKIKADLIRQRPLVNGQEYYFAVTAYSFNPYYKVDSSEFFQPSTPALESAPVILAITPHSLNPGVKLNASSGDTIKPVEHFALNSAALSDGAVYPIVIAPDKLTGHRYKVVFDSAGTWSLIDSTTQQVLLANQTNQLADANSLVVDGLQIRVLGATTGFRDFYAISNAAGPLDPPSYAAFAFNGSGFPNGGNYPAGDRPATNEQTNGSRWGIESYAVDQATFDYAWFLGRTLRGDNDTRFMPNDFEIRFTAAGSKGTDFSTGAILDIPFELWNVTKGFKMIALIVDDNTNGIFDLSGIDHPISGGDNDPQTDRIYWYEPVNTSAGTAGYDAYAALIAAGDTVGSGNEINAEVMARMVLVNYNGGSVSDPTFPANMNAQMVETGTTIRISSTKPNAVNDVFVFSSSAPTFSEKSAKLDVDKINVFPNPYYGMHIRETNRLNKFVTFNHLPDRGRVTIRIFNLAGVLVRTIQGTPGSQFANWNLMNEGNLPVASGIYIVHVDMPDLGKNKILKLAIVQEEQILPTY